MTQTNKNPDTTEMENLLNEDYKETMQGRTEKRMNRFNGESFMLTKEEAIKHDRIFTNELSATLEDKELGYGGSKLWDKVRADLDWFRKNNAEAYMVLLD
jgi:hypothetical protein